MPEESLAERHRAIVERVRKADSFTVTMPVVGTVRIPHPEQLAYYAALAALAAAEIIDWPVALALAAGHALMQDQHNRVAREIGEALEEA
jgi:hypothetical protein